MIKNKLAYPRAPVVALSLLLVGCLAASPLWAGTISDDLNHHSASGPGLGLVTFQFIQTLSPDNDNVGDNNNNIDVHLKVFDNVGYIDIEFLVDDSMGVTEYRVSESVDNNTGIDWAGFRMELGYGVGAAFVPASSVAGVELDFDSPDYDPFPTSQAFVDVDTSVADVLVYSNGTHSSGARIYEFRMDVPNLPQGVTHFTLRQTPIPVPEPATAALVGLAVVLAGGFARRRG